MDGFIGNEGVIVMVVINCFDVFDFVLFCLGCFDWKILVGCLDVKGWEVILKVYVKNKLLVVDVDLKEIVK